ncbi:MAG: SGNH/GDSL hydrolase family protein [Dongiaceae bacterium]
MVGGAYFGRLVPIQLRPECAHYDSRVSYLLKPGACRFDEVLFDTEVSANSFGLRDDEESLIAPDVIVVGDSHAMGHGVADDEAFPAVLERKLGRKVLNAAISSFGTAREMILLRNLDTSAARVIVIQYCDNDLRENRALRPDGTLPILSEGEYRRLVDRASAGYRDWLMPGFGVLERVVAKLEKMASGGAETSGAENPHARAFRDAVAQSVDLLRGRTVLVVELNGGGRPLPGFLDAARQDVADLGLDMTFLDIAAVLRPEDFLPVDGHMRPSGHEKVAAALAAALADNPGNPQP